MSKTVLELIEELSELDGDLLVMVSRDGEGNGFSFLSDVALSGTNHEGEPCHPDDVDEDSHEVVVLWP